MKKRYLLLIIIFGCVCLTILKINYSSSVIAVGTDSISINEPASKPEDIVIEYYRLSKENKIKQITEIVTLYPKSFEDYVRNSSDITGKKPISGEKPKRFDKRKIDDNRQILDYEMEYKNITSQIPSDIQNFGQKVVKIDSVKIINNDARVQIKYLSDSEMKFLDNQYFYLHKEQEQWKIFSVCDFMCTDFSE